MSARLVSMSAQLVLVNVRPILITEVFAPVSVRSSFERGERIPMISPRVSGLLGQPEETAGGVSATTGTVLSGRSAGCLGDVTLVWQRAI